MSSAAKAVPHVVVLGGGVAGLAASYALKRSAQGPLRVTLVEASNRLGGWLWSERKDGFLFERGCRGIRPVGNGKEVMRLVEELHLQPQTLVSAPTAKLRYIWHNGRLEVVPTSLVGALTSPLTRTAPLWLLRDLVSPSGPRADASAAEVATAALSDPTSPLAATAAELELLAAQAGDESLASFATRRFGPHVANVLLDALMSGVWAGDVNQLSARSVMPALVRLEAKHRSVVLGLIKEAIAKRRAAKEQGSSSAEEEDISPFVAAAATASSVSFVDGTQTLTDALAAALRTMPNMHILTETAAAALEPRANGVRLHLKGSAGGATSSKSNTIEADAVISAVPAKALASLLPQASCPQTVRACSEIPTISVGVVSCAWHHAATPASSPSQSVPEPYRPPLLPKEGFGYLVPSRERTSGRSPNVLGMTWDSEVFPGQMQSWADKVKSQNWAWLDSARKSVAAPGKAPTPSHPGLWGSGYLLPGSALDIPTHMRRSETRVTVMMGGATAPEIASSSPDALVHLARQALLRQTGISAAPSTVNVHLEHHAIPQYTVGHSERLQQIRKELTPLFGAVRNTGASAGASAEKQAGDAAAGGAWGRLRLVGNAWQGVGVADAVSNGLAAGRSLAKQLTGHK
jgi:oxygen-dependent protoporphyrinogen oxidase